MRHWVLAGILLLAFLVQSVFGGYLTIRGIAPNVVLVVVVVYGLLFGWQMGLAAGVLGGLLLDLNTSQLIGSHVLALAAVGLLVGLVEEGVFKDNLILPLAGGIAGSLLGQTILVGCMWLFRRSYPLGDLRAALFPTALYDVILCVLVYTRVYKYYRYLRPDPRGTIILRRR